MSVVTGILASCGVDSADINTPFPPDDGTAGSGSTGGSGGNGDTGTGGDPNDTGTGIPCDVATALEHSCNGCHTNPTKDAAPMALVTRQDLIAMSPTYAGSTIADRCLARMNDNDVPMPPTYYGPRATGVDRTAFANWISAGLPSGTCMVTGTGGGTGGGTASSGGGTASSGGGTASSGGGTASSGGGTSSSGGGSSSSGGGSGVDYTVCQSSVTQCEDASGQGDYACVDPNTSSGAPTSATTCTSDADCAYDYSCWQVTSTKYRCLQSCGSSALSGGAGGGTGAGGGSATGGGSASGGGSATGGGGGTSCGTDTWSNYGSSFFTTTCMTACHQHTGEFTQSDVQTYASTIKSRISSGSMPQGSSLTSAQKTRIIAYLTCGAP